MFYRFNAHRASKPQPRDTSTDRFAKTIAGRVHFVQSRWASLMDKYARRIPLKWLKALLIAFIFGAGTYCIYLIQDGMFSQAPLLVKNFDFSRLWPFDPSGQKEKLQKQSALGFYLDSLEREVKRDSLENPQYYTP